MKLYKFALPSLLMLSTASVMLGNQIGVTVGGPFGTDINNSSWMLGYSFTANSAIQVVGLGLYDDNGTNGLNSAHDVGLWDSQGNLIASATVPAGLGGTLISNFMFASIAPLQLTAGQTYTVGAEYTVAQGDNWAADPTNFGVAPQITYISREYDTYSGTLIEPTLVGSNSIGYFGGNIEFGSAVPEPSSIAPLALALLALGYAWRRRAAAIA
ncbi:MAG TPA: DUF4082 domain-containing protein [Bryobacteraceae bacterium]|jgi:hypothetical protein|nr:DUF4082 domain-containing protein [Bryobacteraceae bacterium]